MNAKAAKKLRHKAFNNVQGDVRKAGNEYKRVKKEFKKIKQGDGNSRHTQS